MSKELTHTGSAAVGSVSFDVTVIDSSTFTGLGFFTVETAQMLSERVLN